MIIGVKEEKLQNAKKKIRLVTVLDRVLRRSHDKISDAAIIWIQNVKE